MRYELKINSPYRSLVPSQQSEREYTSFDVPDERPDVVGKGVPGLRPLRGIDHGTALRRVDRVLAQRSGEPACQVGIHRHHPASCPPPTGPTTASKSAKVCHRQQPRGRRLRRRHLDATDREAGVTSYGDNRVPPPGPDRQVWPAKPTRSRPTSTPPASPAPSPWEPPPPPAAPSTQSTTPVERPTESTSTVPTPEPPRPAPQSPRGSQPPRYAEPAATAGRSRRGPLLLAAGLVA